MKNIIVKSWIYEEIQTKAQQYMRTIVWDKQYRFDNEGNEYPVYKISVADVVNETEKAICFNCNFWSTRSQRVNFTVYNGHKVWIPKSAIIEMA